MKMFYTIHARQRMALRVISENEVIETIEKGTSEFQLNNKIQVVHKNTRVILSIDKDQNIVTIITVIHSKPFQKKVRKYSRRNNCSLRQATIKLKQTEVS